MNSYNYEYGSTPRKINPDHKRKKQIEKKKNEEYKKQLKRNEEQKKRALKLEKKKHQKNVVLVVAIFLILLGISYRNSLINERFKDIQKQKKELSSIEKTNGQLEVSIQENINLGAIEQSAREKLGMQKLDNTQKVYVVLDKKDYVETKSKEITIESNEEESFLKKILNKIIGK